MPIEYENQSKEEKEQEQHMIYVALTRCLARAKGGILWLVLAAKNDFLNGRNGYRMNIENYGKMIIFRLLSLILMIWNVQKILIFDI